MIKRVLSMAFVASTLAACSSPPPSNGIGIGIVSSTDNGALTLAMPGQIVGFEADHADLARMQPVPGAPAGQQLVLMDRATAQRVAAPVNLSGHVVSNAAVRLADGTIVWGRISPTREASVPTAPAAVQ